MTIEVLRARGGDQVQRHLLHPGEATPWHIDPCRRYFVVLGGDRLKIEFLDGAPAEEFPVHRGMAGWDEPEPRMHRAINTGTEPYMDIVTVLSVHLGR